MNSFKDFIYFPSFSSAGVAPELKQNFKFVETNLDLSKKTWYANIWCYND